MSIGPILASLKRNKTQAALIVLEIALSCAIVSNAIFMISQRMERMERSTGMADDQIVRINVAGVGENGSPGALVRQDLAELRALEGVKSATSLNHVPFDNSSWNSSVKLDRNQRAPSLNGGTYLRQDLVATLGLRLVEGRDFTPDEYVDWEQFNS